MKVSEAIKLAEQHGWVYKSTKGDHRKFVKEGAPRALIIPGKLSADLPKGTEGCIKRMIENY